MKFELALKLDAEVGEGPLWDSDKGELVFIDVTQGKIHSFNPITGNLDSLSIGMHIGAVGLFESNSYIAAVRDGFAKIDRYTGQINYLSRVLHDEGIRFNDGKCDPFGNFVAGTMRYQPAMGTAALYSLSRSGRVKEILSGIGLSNGLCWDESGEKFFYIDTLTRQIALFKYDSEQGIVGSRQVIYEFAEGAGSPDGMTIDLDGNLWVALWGGGKVVRIDQSGRLISELELPVSQPTSVIFGGSNYENLYITSANFQLSDAQLSREPLAGSLFVADVGVGGRAESRFALSS
ncbi:MAG: hypothetical protein RLZZ527_50 [Actinomycetota bacterium]